MPSVTPPKPLPTPTSGTAEDALMQPASDGALCEHQKRPGWGLAIRVWIRGDHRGYQFEDGKLRVITAEFEPMMRPVERSSAETERLQGELWKLSGLTRARQTHQATADQDDGCAVSFDEQVALLLTDYPDGFADAAWIRDARGRGATRVSTRHREPAIERALALLGVDELVPLVQGEHYDVVYSRAQRALQGCSLVSSSQRAPLSCLHPASYPTFARALHQWLHGNDGLDQAFERLVASLDSSKRTPSWPLVTAFGALVHPHRHICIRPSVFLQQARVLRHGTTLHRRPTYDQYELMRKLVEDVTEQLHSRHHPPRDWMDVHDFVWMTMRPAAVARIEAQRKPATAPETSRSE